MAHNSERPQNYFWAEVGDRSPGNSSSQRAVRQHVMRDVVLKRKIESVERLKPTIPGRFGALYFQQISKTSSSHSSHYLKSGSDTTSSSDEDLELADPVETLGHGKGVLPLPEERIWHELGGGGLDPFGNLSLQLDPRAQSMLAYFLSVYTPSLSADNSRSSTQGQAYFQQATNGALALNVSLAVAFAVAFNTEPNASPGPAQQTHADWLRYKAATIKLLNHRLSSTKAEYLDDETLFGVLMLAGSETWLNQYTEGRMHLKAFTRLAALRGGFRTINVTQLEQVIMVDVFFASMNNTDLITSPHEIHSAVDKAAPEWSLMPNLATSAVITFLGPVMNNAEANLARAYNDLSTMAVILNQAHSGILPANYTSNIKTVFLRGWFIAYHLETWPLLPRSAPSLGSGVLFEVPSERVALWESCRISMLLLIRIIHSKGFPRSLMLRALIIRLQNLLGLSDLTSLWRRAPDLLLWILFLGVRASPGQIEHIWFTEQLADYAKLESWSWPQTRKRLKRLPYIDKDMDEPFEHIWEQALTGHQNAW